MTARRPPRPRIPGLTGEPVGSALRQGRAVIDIAGVTAAAEGIADGQARAMFSNT